MAARQDPQREPNTRHQERWRQRATFVSCEIPQIAMRLYHQGNRRAVVAQQQLEIEPLQQADRKNITD